MQEDAEGDKKEGEKKGEAADAKPAADVKMEDADKAEEKKEEAEVRARVCVCVCACACV